MPVESPLHKGIMRYELAFFDPQTVETSRCGAAAGQHGFSVKVWTANQHDYPPFITEDMFCSLYSSLFLI